MLRREDGHVLRAVELEVEGQRKKGRTMRTYSDHITLRKKV